MSRRSAALWASLLPWIAGCLTDLAVGYGELDDPATSVVDAGDASVRDAASSDAGARDAGELDARAARDASCDGCPDAATRDATVAQDASATRDAAVRDAAAARDAATHDARTEDAGDQCIPSDCEYVGLVVTFLTCEMGKEPVCTLTDKGVCDLVCAGLASSTGLAKGDASTRDAEPSRRPDAGERTSGEDAAVTSEPYEAADAAVPAQDGAVTVEAESDAEVSANDP